MDLLEPGLVPRKKIRKWTEINYQAVEELEKKARESCGTPLEIKLYGFSRQIRENAYEKFIKHYCHVNNGLVREKLNELFLTHFAADARVSFRYHDLAKQGTSLNPVGMYNYVELRGLSDIIHHSLSHLTDIPDYYCFATETSTLKYKSCTIAISKVRASGTFILRVPHSTSPDCTVQEEQLRQRLLEADVFSTSFSTGESWRVNHNSLMPEVDSEIDLESLSTSSSASSSSSSSALSSAHLSAEPTPSPSFDPCHSNQGTASRDSSELIRVPFSLNGISLFQFDRHNVHRVNRVEFHYCDLPPL